MPKVILLGNKIMLNFLVTGCAGFIGSHLTEKLLSKGHRVTGIDNFSSFYPRSIKERNMSSFRDHPQFQFFEIDLRDKESYPVMKLKEQICCLNGILATSLTKSMLIIFCDFRSSFSKPVLLILIEFPKLLVKYKILGSPSKSAEL